MITKKELIEYILSHEIPEDIELLKETEYNSQLFEYTRTLTPQSLYRYRNCNSYSFEALENDKFLLTKPTLFNDPYDSLLFIDRENIINRLCSTSDNDQTDLILQLNQDLEYRESQIKLLGEDFVNHFLKKQPFKSQQEKIFYKKLSNKIYSKLVDNIIDEAIKSLKQSSLIACLSERVDSILMWSHYAQNHEGFALNYDFKSRFIIDIGIPDKVGSEFADKQILPIHYTNERFDATYYAEFHFIDNYYRSLGIEFKAPFFDKQFYYKHLLFKSLEWSYDKEWRIIKLTTLDYENNITNFDFITNIRPKEIYLGAQISNSNKERLVDIGKSKNINVYQMKVNPFSKEYKLTYEII